jgi:hypothetical protein
LRGLGFNYFDLLAQADIQSCSPLDEACVANNEAKATAAQNLWTTQYMTHAETADMPVPNIDFSVNTSGLLASDDRPAGSLPAGTGYTTVYVNGQPISDVTLRQAADTQLANTIAAEIKGGAPQNAATAELLRAGGVTVPAPKPATTSTGATAPGAPQILGMQVEGSPAFTLPGGVEVPALPWWALVAGAAGLAWFAFGRGK